MTIPTPAAVLRQRYPLWFSELPYYGFSLPHGWTPLVFELFERIDMALTGRGSAVVEFGRRKPLKVLQIKEKFGGLRIYVWGGTPKVNDIIREGEAMSHMICAHCGAPGELRHLDFMLTLCDAHFAEIRERMGGRP